jgi:multiple sugar transport system permease protein
VPSQASRTFLHRVYLRRWVIATIAMLTVASLPMLFPIIWTISTSLKVQAEAFTLPPHLWPRQWRLQNYVEVFADPYVPIPLFFLNSLKIATSVTIGQLVTCTMSAYAFARLRFPGRNFLFFLLLTSLMVPYQVTIIPTYILMRVLGLIDTHGALIIPNLVSVFGVFLLRQFFLTIPDELEDSARIDGAGPVRILWQIMVPLVMPGIATLAIISFNASWNSFFGPLIFLNSWRSMTWPLGLAVLKGVYGQGSVSVQMAGISVAVIPVAIIFILGQRYIVESITFTGLKG